MVSPNLLPFFQKKRFKIWCYRINRLSLPPKNDGQPLISKDSISYNFIMAKFNVGDNVVHALSPDRKGFVIQLCPPRRGPQLYKVLFTGENAPVDVSEIQLKPYFNISDPFERCEQNIYGNFVEFSRINTAFKIQNSNNSTISSLKASKTLFRAFQFKPLLKFLNSDNRRLLVADEVGLGKTIEAGHIMLELKARNELRNVLIVCPNSLKVKWQTELDDKFGLAFDIIENTNDFINKLKMHDGNVRVIVNYEKLRLPKEKKTEDDRDKKQDELNILNYIEKEDKKFSLILCDEAHKLRNRETQTYKGAEILMRHCASAIFLTATPIMISEENLYNLMHLLNNELYDNKWNFLNALSVNRPFVRAQSDIRHQVPLNVIADYLQNTKVYTSYEIGEDTINNDQTLAECFKDFPIYQRIIRRLSGTEDSKKLRAEILADLEEMSPMSGTFSRTRKRDVTTDMSQPERNPILVPIQLNPEEAAIYRDAIEEYEWNSLTDQGLSLALTTLKRQVASSIWAYKNATYRQTITDRGNIKTDISDLAKGIDYFADKEDTKVNELDKVIKRVFNGGVKKIVVFAIFTHTILYLAIRLKKLGYNCAIIYGGNVDEREDAIRRFREDPSVNVLLSSEVGSEGLDMQFCNSLVNYDLPWNPMVVEQRIGRIDRFGQQSQVVNIYNFVIKDSIQEVIYTRLLDRIGIFHSSIGDMEAILDAEIESSGKKITIQQLYDKTERELYTSKLTEEQRRKKIDEIAQAFETEKKNLRDIEEGLTNALTNDAYFREQVDKILKNNSYVTDVELKNFIEMMRIEALPACRIIDKGNEIFDFVMPQAGANMISSFLTSNQPVGQEYNTLFQRFKNRITDVGNTITLTFNQDVAYNISKVIFINLYHPLIIASLEFFKKSHKDDTDKRTFEFQLPAKLLTRKLPSKQIFMAVYQIDESREVYGQTKKSATLYPILFDTLTQQVIEDQELADEFLGIVQIGGQNLSTPSVKNFSSAFYNEMRGAIKDAIDKKTLAQYEESNLKIENDRKKRIQFVQKNFDLHKERLEARLFAMLDYYADIEDLELEARKENFSRTTRLFKGQLKSLEEQLQNQLDTINKDQHLLVQDHLLSLNLINLI